MARFMVGLVLLTVAGGRLAAEDKWPEWRGARGQGISTATDLPVQWSESRNIAWKTKIPGRGWSTPVIANGKVWVTTAIDKPASKADAKRRRAASDNSQPLIISESVSLRAVGLDLKTGKLLHNIEVLSQKEPQMIHIENSYATPTPILEKGRLYCHFGPIGMSCLDVTTGKVVWQNRELEVQHENGPGSSPILWKNLLIVHCDGIDQQYIVALDKRTGKQVWKAKRSGTLRDNPQMRKSYATSLIAEVDGQPQVISPAADWIYGYEPATGRELWKLNYGQLGFSNAARPVVGGGMIFVCTGYMKAQMLAVKIEQPGGAARPKVVWKHTKQVPNVSCPLLLGNEIYFTSDKGIASCLDARTGEVHWTERIGKQFWASPLFADGRIYFLDREGITTVVAPGKKFQKLATNKLAGTHMASPAVVDGSLVLRTEKAVYCVRSKQRDVRTRATGDNSASGSGDLR